jgi:hypothetical protein
MQRRGTKLKTLIEKELKEKVKKSQKKKKQKIGDFTQSKLSGWSQ